MTTDEDRRRPRPIELSFARPGSVGAYGVALLSVAVATSLRLVLDRWIVGSYFVTFFPAVIVATYYCGARAGALAVLLCITAAWFFIVPPRLSWVLEVPGTGAGLALFAAALALVAAMIVRLRIVLRDLDAALALDTAIFEDNPDAILVVDADGRIVRLNRRCVELFGYDARQLIGSTVDILVPDRHRASHHGHRDGFLAAPKTRSMGSGLELMARRADGREFPVDVQIGPLTRGGQTQVVVNVRDVTVAQEARAALVESRRQQAILAERQRSAEALREAHVMLATVIEAAPIAIYAVGRDERITIWNPAAASLYGQIPPELRKTKSWRELLTGEVVPPGEISSTELLDRAMAQDGFRDLEIRRRARDGSLRDLSISSAVLRGSDDTVTGVLFLARDISDQKRLELQLRQSQKLEAIGQLTGGIAHDFNNLLAVIYGNLELLAEECKDDVGIQELIDSALRASERGASMTHQLLAYSRRQPLMPVPLDLAAHIGSTVGMLRRILPESIAIATTFASDLHRCQIDPQQLDNALLNLAINARDAMPSGGLISIDAENAVVGQDDAGRDIAAGTYIRLTFADDGAGMSPEVLSRALEPFYSTKPMGSGTGLGLSMVYGFIKQSGGHMTIASEPGHGTRISLLLPEAARQSGSPHPPTGQAVPARQNRTILVVEDDPNVRRLQVRILSGLSYTVIEAEDGPAALGILRAERPIDLLMTDIVLPNGISGTALAATARELRPTLPILFVSGYSPEDQDGLPPPGPLLYKPFTRQDLVRALDTVFEASEPS